MNKPSIWQQLRLSKNEIRLLTIYPSIDADESISCSLSIANLDQNPAYLALSYTWGDPTRTVPISLDGHSWQVTSNLHDGLRCLRDLSKPLTIFVDALCINQQDLDEKNVQVPMMGRIYSQASKVHCWIGQADTESTRAPEIFTRASSAVDLDVCFQDEPLDLADMQSLAHFLGMPYWKRAWIIQEVVLASEVVFHYGKHQISKQDLPKVVDFIHSIHGVLMRFLESNSSDETYSVVNDVNNAYHHNIRPFLSTIGTLSGVSLSRIGDAQLVTLMKQAATVKHDHVYAFLSILDPELRQRIKPDYRLEAVQVFRDFAFKSMQVTGRSKLLSYAVGLTENPLDLPSWVPDFSNGQPIGPTDSPFDANQQAQTDLVMYENGSLGVAAFRLDHVVAVQSVIALKSDVGDLKDDPKEAAAMHTEWRKFFGLTTEADPTCFYVGGGTLEEAYWNAMSRGRIAVSGMGWKPRWLVSDDLNSMSAWLCQVVRQPDLEIPTTMANIAWQYNSQLTSLWYYQVLGKFDENTAPSSHIFKTANGYIGTTYRNTAPQIDDVVYLIAGSAAPTVLRPAQPNSHGEATFRLVTHAYMPGLMLPGIMPEDATAEQSMIDYENYVHPHMKIATSWDRIWLR